MKVEQPSISESKIFSTVINYKNNNADNDKGKNGDVVINNQEKKVNENPLNLRWRISAHNYFIKPFLAAFIYFFIIINTAFADTPVTLYESLAGTINITGTGGTLRTQPDSGNECLVTNSGSMTLSGLPAGATIVRAYLYWAGSGGDPVGGAAADYNVTFDGTNITADRTFTAWNLPEYFFQGIKDVTSQVAAKGNGTYTFSNLTVQNANVGGGGQYCTASRVLSAFSLVVVYSSPSETLHVVNLWEGFQTYWGSSITLSPSNFIIPNPVPANSARHLVLTWEGDFGNSGARNGFNENLTFCAPIGCTGTPLTDAYNPANNQFNSTVDVPPSGPYLGPDVTWGVDLDLYDVTGRFSAGNAGAVAVYSSGQDFVILANQTMSVPNVPTADLEITKSHSGNFAVGTNGVYTIRVTNNGPSSTSGTVTVSDTLPTGLTYVSGTGTAWTCGAAGQTVTCTYSGSLASGASASAITLTVSVGNAAYPSVTNTATVTDTSGAFDNVAGNNTSSDVTTVIGPNLSTSAKTVVDLNGGDTLPGDTLRYTITINETNGAVASSVSVSDPIDANLTSVTPVSCGGGGTCSYTAPNLSCSGISVPANGSVTIVYTANISGSAAPGTTINNTATITPSVGTGGTAVAPVVTVAGTSSGTGTKPLYLYDGTSTPAWKLSRTLNTTSANYATLTFGGVASQIWSMNPVAASNITISSTVSATVPVTLYMRRGGLAATGGDRNIRVDLQCSSGGTILTQTQTLNLNATITAYTFNLPLAGTVSCGTGNYWNLTVTQTNQAGRPTRVYPQNGGTPSSVNLPATTVINVNSIRFYDNTAYPGGNLLATVTAGSTIRIRAVVSDPFGSYDIVTAPTIIIKNPSGTAVTPPGPAGASMTLVATGTETPSLTKTYEYSYTVPSSPTGNWSVSVAATEGTEPSPVTNTAYDTMPVTINLATLTILKSANPYPSVASGQTITYTIAVSNTSAGTATNAVVTDPVPTFTTYVANSTRLNGITVAGDGATSPLIAGLPIDNDNSRAPGAVATGIMPAGATATITFQVRVD